MQVPERKMFTVRFSVEELARLEKVAAHYGLTSAGVLRMLLKREEDALAKRTEPPAAAKPRKR